MAKTKITGGIYLVIDPAIDMEILLGKLEIALKAGIQAVQIWDNWSGDANKLSLINAVGGLCDHYATPLLINNDWQLLASSPLLKGVHFDMMPEDLGAIKQAVGRPFLAGITCSGDLDIVKWGHSNKLDYVSFCAMFPSPSASTCTIVMPETVKEARSLTNLAIFVSGGITPQNIKSLKKVTAFDGVAVISGILKAQNPEEIINEYKNALGIKD